MSCEILIQLTDVSLWRRTQEEFAYDLKETLFNWLRRDGGRSARKQVLADISLEVCRGETVGLVGANGAGKSTLLKVISGILEPQQGQVKVRGNIAPLIELGAGFDPELSIEDNIFMYGIMLGFSRRYLKEKIDNILDFAELHEYRYQPVKSLSSGMTARLGFAIATDVSPDILILDEVLSVGDARFKQKCKARLEGFLKGQTTVLMVSHDLETIVKECSRVIWIEHGRIRDAGDSKEVVNRYLESLGLPPVAQKQADKATPTLVEDSKHDRGSNLFLSPEETKRLDYYLQEVVGILQNAAADRPRDLESIESTLRAHLLEKLNRN